MSKAKSGENNPMFGKHHSGESKKKITKNHPDNSGDNNPMFGKHHSEETKKKMSKAIVNHHYIYDFNDLSKYTIPVTTSEHVTIHNNLRRVRLEVPCINILKSDSEKAQLS